MRTGCAIRDRQGTVGRGLAVLMLLATSPACEDPASRTRLNPDGPPEILQAFVTVRNPANGETSLAATFGRHSDLDPMTDPLDCEEPDDWRGCLDSSTMQMNAVADATQRIRLVFDELLNGETVEKFVCACVAKDLCGAGPTSASDPPMCPGDDKTEGKWADTNFDGNPDDAVLLPGIVSVTCGTMTWQNTEPDGYYFPSGNQLVPVGAGLEGLGPALVFTIADGLPTNTNCTVAVAATVTDKSETPAVLDPDITGGTLQFHTEPLVVTSMPAEGESPDATTLANVTLAFNYPLDMTSIGGVVVVTVPAMGNPVAVPGVATLSDDHLTITWTPEAEFAAATTYRMTIPTSIKDEKGGAFPAEKTVTFTTM